MLAGWLELRRTLWPHDTREQHLAEMSSFLENPRRFFPLFVDPKRMRASPRVAAWLNRVVGTMLVGFGVKLAVGR